MLDRQGVLSIFESKSGAPVSKTRVGGSYWATPVIAGDLMYFFASNGVARVVNLQSMEVVHKHEFKDQEFLGSPAVSGDAIFVRSNEYLWKITNTDDSST